MLACPAMQRDQDYPILRTFLPLPQVIIVAYKMDGRNGTIKGHERLVVSKLDPVNRSVSGFHGESLKDIRI